MPDLPSTLPDLSWLNSLTPFDAILLGVVVLYGLGGTRRGLIAGTLGLASVLATIYVALVGTQPAAELWQRLYPANPLPPTLTLIATFIILLAVAQLVFGSIARVLLGALTPLRPRLGPLRFVERALGFLPGAAQGLLICALVLIPLYLFSVIPPLNAAVDRSAVVGEVTRRVQEWDWPVETLLGRTATVEVPLPSRVIQPGEHVRVPRSSALEPDPEAETRMLQLLNAERAVAGLRPLVADERLRAVAREHSQEMFRLGYFSHTSPTTGAPGDRLQRHGIAFAIAGENLAYAPTVEVAHSGLMASPGHRRNILAPEFTRVGIGVVRGRWVGRMFTQNFAS